MEDPNQEPRIDSQSLSNCPTIDKELYKVTEYNESLECSVLENTNMAGNNCEDLSAKLASSLIDKFPKLSIASLSVSDTSMQNAYEMYKRSYLEYVEPLEVNFIATPEKTSGEIAKQRMSPCEVTTYAVTLSESNAVKNTIETKTECCECIRCCVF
jgi:hypothetical protein